MQKEPKYTTVSRYLQYNKMHNWNPIKPFALWANTNDMLDKFYKQPDINLGTSTKDNNIRNTMRHIVGPALMTKEFGSNITRSLGALKEGFDFIEKRDLNDNFIDFRNNNLGIDFIEKNPNKTNNEIMKYAYEQAQKNYHKDYESTLYKYLTE